MIRNQLVQQLRKALGDSSSFEAEDFVIQAKQGSGAITTVTITPRFASGYSFEARISSTRGTNIALETRPGLVTEHDTGRVTDWDDVVNEARAWRDRIASELKADPIGRQVDAQRQELEKLLGTVGKVEDTYFTQEEAVSLRDKLDALEETLTEQIEKAAESETQAKSRIDALHRDIESLKQGLDSLKKPGWVQRAMVKVTKWARDPEMRAVLKTGATEVVKGLLKSGHGGG